MLNKWISRILIVAVVGAGVTVCAILWPQSPNVAALAVSVSVSSVTTNSENGRVVAQFTIINTNNRVLRVGEVEMLLGDQTPKKPKPARMMLIPAGKSVPFQFSTSRSRVRWRLSLWVYPEPGRVAMAARGVVDGLRKIRVPISAYEPGFHQGAVVFSGWIE